MQLIRFPQRKHLPTGATYHWPRRLFHAMSGVFLVIFSYLFEDKREYALVLLFGSLFELGLEMLRLRSPRLQDLSRKLFGRIMRKGEDRKISGIPYYLLGCTVCFIIFPRPIAILSVLYLAIGDPVASIAGVYAKRMETVSELKARKSWQGSLACVAVCAFLTFFLYPWLFSFRLEFLSALMLSLVGGMAAGLAELLPFRTDDNLSLPVVSGSLLWLYASLTGLIPGLVS